MENKKMLIGVDNIEGYVTSQEDIFDDTDVFWRAYVLYPVVNVDKEHVALITELDNTGYGRIVERKDFNGAINDTSAKFIQAKKINAIAGFSE